MKSQKPTSGNHTSYFTKLSIPVTIITLLIAFIPGTYAQVAPIGSAAQAAQTNTISSFTAPAGTNRVLIVTVSDALSTNITSATFNAMSMTKQSQETDGTAVDAVYTLSLGTSASATIANIVVASSNSNHTGKFITARVFEKAHQTTPLINIQKEHNSTSGSSFNITSAANDLALDIFDTWISSAGGTRTPGTGQTIMHNSGAIDLGGDGAGFAYYATSTKSGAASVTMSWTTNHSALIHIAASIKQASAPLPVTLLSFNALLQQRDISLNWETTDAVNFSHFEVERSSDAINFSTVGQRASINAIGKISYNYTDVNAAAALPGQDKIYYRLKMVDIDGSFSYSKVVLVQLGKNEEVFITGTQPNPFTNKINISLHLPEDKIVTIRLIDIVGRIAHSKQLFVNKGFSTHLIDGLEKLDKGVYMLQVRSGSEVMMKKMVKQ